jgi:hypothetical protein
MLYGSDALFGVCGTANGHAVDNGVRLADCGSVARPDAVFVSRRSDKSDANGPGLAARHYVVFRDDQGSDLVAVTRRAAGAQHVLCELMAKQQGIVR